MTILPSPSLLNQINQFIQGGEFSLNYGLFLLSWKSGLRVSEAVSFGCHLKHPRHKNLYLINGKGNKTRYVYINKEIIQELKTNRWKPNQTNRINFYHFLQKTKRELNISPKIELTPHTLRRCFTTHNALNGVPMPILQKVLGHANIRTTSCYWKGSVDIRKFGGWLEPDSSPKEPDRVPRVEISPKTPKIGEIPIQPEIILPASPPLEKDPVKSELLKTIEKLKGELAEKDKQLQNKDSKISLLTNENEKLQVINQKKDRKLKELQGKIKEIDKENNSLLQNYLTLKNAAENKDKNPVNNNQTPTEPPKEKAIPKILLNSAKNSPNTLLKIKEKENNPLATKEQEVELIAEIQVWKPPN